MAGKDIIEMTLMELKRLGTGIPPEFPNRMLERIRPIQERR